MVTDTIHWSRTRAGMLAMMAFNIFTVAVIGYVIYEWRAERHAAERIAQQYEVQRLEWLASTLYQATEIEVMPGSDMETTRVVERPVFDGDRVVEAFSGQWVVRLRHVATDALLCTMPATGPGSANYTPAAPRMLYMTWQAYTGDDGSCWARIRPGEEYDLTVERLAETNIGGKHLVRRLPPVSSAPFAVPGRTP